jgi:Yip1 domain
MSTFSKRLVGAVRLDARIFEEVEADPAATGQAMLAVVLSSLAAGIGTASVGGFRLAVLTMGTVVALISWVAWAILTYLIGTRVFAEPQTRADVSELLRTTGFAFAPGLFRVIGVLPGLGWIVYVVTSIWILAAMVIGVRQALDFTTTGRAIAVCAAGWILSLFIAFLVGVSFGPTVQ